MDDTPTIREPGSDHSAGDGTIDVPAHRLLRVIGEGSYGEIWLAINAMGTYRAVKVVNRSRFKDDRPYEREYEGIKKFEPLSRAHEGFVDILQVERNDRAGYFYYVMELADDVVRGQDIDPNTYFAATLSSLADGHGRMPLKDCLAVGITLAGTLDFLHKHNLVHRDIKSANIVLLNGRPKLADIGLVTDIRSDSTYVGTPGFIPPEGPGAPAADIYSLGKVLYEISTGLNRDQFPRMPDNSLVEEPGGGFLEWNAILLKSCEDDVTRRYHSAAELQAHLALVRAGKSVRRLLQFERSIALARRVGPVAAAILIVLAVALFQGAQTRKRAAEERQRQAGAAVTSGSIRLAGGDYLGALPPFLRALEIDAGDAAKTRTHRVRIASLLRHSPALIHVSYRTNHTGPAVFGATANEILSAQPDRRFAVWNFRDGRVLSPPLEGGKKIEDHVEERAAFDSDFRRIVTSFGGTKAMIRDARTGQLLHTLPHGAYVISARFNHDGRRVVCTLNKSRSAYVWNLEEKERIEFTLATQTNALWHAEFSPDGRRVVAGATDGTVFIWNLAAPDQPHLIYTGHQYWVQGVTFSPDSRLVATASGDHTVRVWEAETGRDILPPLAHDDHVMSVEFSRDSRWLLTACLDHTARVWEVATGRQAFPAMYHPTRLNQAAFSPDATRVVTTTIDGSLCVWELRVPKPAVAPPLIAFSADGLRSAALTNQSIEVRHTDDARLISSIATGPASVTGLALSADGTLLLSVSSDRDRRAAQLWDVSSGQLRGSRIPFDAGLTNLVLAPSGRRLAAFGGTNFAVWDAETGGRLGLFNAANHPGARPIERLAFDRAGRRLALVCSKSKVVELWRVAPPETRLTTVISNTLQASHVEFSPNERFLLIATSDASLRAGLVQVFDAETGDPAGPPLPHTDGVRHAAFSPDSSIVLTCGEDFAAVLWEARTGARLPIDTMRHREYVRHGAFSRDGRWIVTTEKNGIVRLWDAATGSLLAPPLNHASWIYSAEFAADGRRLVTRSADGQMLLWEIPEDQRPLDHLRLIAEVVSGQPSVRARASRTPSPDELRRNWRQLHTLYPADFSPGR